MRRGRRSSGRAMRGRGYMIESNGWLMTGGVTKGLYAVMAAKVVRHLT